MGLMLGLYDAPPSSGGRLLFDASAYIAGTGATISTNDHGFEALPTSIQRKLSEALRFYDQSGLIYIGLFGGGLIVWEGRLEDPSVVAGDQGSGLNIQALGAWRALTDRPYTALWSTTSVAGFLPTNQSQIANRVPERWQFDTNNRLYLAPKKNENFTNVGTVGALTTETPNGGSRTFAVIQFDWEMTAPANWQARCTFMDRSFGSNVVVWTQNATGALQTGSVCVATSADRVEFAMFNNTGANVLKASDTGADYLKITNLRIASSITNLINTTLGTTILAGTRTVTPGSMARIIVGMQLIIDSGSATIAERVTVTAVTSTTFTAVFAFGHANTASVRTIIVYADEIAKDLVAVTNALNSTQLSSSTALIQSPALDLTDEIYEDQLPADILSHLVALGDNQTPPRQWEACVWEGRVLAFRPRGDAARAWYVDVTDLGIARTLEDLANSVYGVYQDASGRTLRTAANADSASIARYGLTRRQALSADTTSSTQAGVQRDAQMADHKDPLPRASVSFEAVYDAAGSRYPLWMVRSGDTITIRNLPPTSSTSIDRIRTFRISHTAYNLMTRELEIELEVPPPRLATLLARRAEGIR